MSTAALRIYTVAPRVSLSLFFLRFFVRSLPSSPSLSVLPARPWLFVFNVVSLSSAPPPPHAQPNPFCRYTGQFHAVRSPYSFGDDLCASVNRVRILYPLSSPLPSHPCQPLPPPSLFLSPFFFQCRDSQTTDVYAISCFYGPVLQNCRSCI